MMNNDQYLQNMEGIANNVQSLIMRNPSHKRTRAAMMALKQMQNGIKTLQQTPSVNPMMQEEIRKQSEHNDWKRKVEKEQYELAKRNQKLAPWYKMGQNEQNKLQLGEGFTSAGSYTGADGKTVRVRQFGANLSPGIEYERGQFDMEVPKLENVNSYEDAAKAYRDIWKLPAHSAMALAQKKDMLKDAKTLMWDLYKKKPEPEKPEPKKSDNGPGFLSGVFTAIPNLINAGVRGLNSLKTEEGRRKALEKLGITPNNVQRYLQTEHKKKIRNAYRTEKGLEDWLTANLNEDHRRSVAKQNYQNEVDKLRSVKLGSKGKLTVIDGKLVTLPSDNIINAEDKARASRNLRNNWLKPIYTNNVKPMGEYVKSQNGKMSMVQKPPTDRLKSMVKDKDFIKYQQLNMPNNPDSLKQNTNIHYPSRKPKNIEKTAMMFTKSKNYKKFKQEFLEKNPEVLRYPAAVRPEIIKRMKSEAVKQYKPVEAWMLNLLQQEMSYELNSGRMW